MVQQMGKFWAWNFAPATNLFKKGAVLEPRFHRILNDLWLLCHQITFLLQGPFPWDTMYQTTRSVGSLLLQESVECHGGALRFLFFQIWPCTLLRRYSAICPLSCPGSGQTPHSLPRGYFLPIVRWTVQAYSSVHLSTRWDCHVYLLSWLVEAKPCCHHVYLQAHFKELMYTAFCSGWIYGMG